MGASNDDDRGVIPAVFSSILTLVPRRSRVPDRRPVPFRDGEE